MSAGPEVLILTYAADDPEAPRLARALASMGVDTSDALWRLDARDEEARVDAAPGWFRLERGGRSLSSAELAGAGVVIHRTGIGRWARPVAVTSGTGAERQFAEREWSSLLHGLLLEAEQRWDHLVWLNRPSISWLSSQKYQLLATAELDGLQVPRLRVSTEGLLPGSASGQYVCKAINEDETIDDRRTLATALVPEDVVGGSPFRTTCPSLIQERVEIDHELRVYHLLGELLAVRITARCPGYVDVRLVAADSLAVEPAEVPRELGEAVRRYCRRHQLSYCVLDFLATSGGQDLLVDVNPSGSWAYLEGPARGFVTDWYAGVLGRTLRSRRSSPSPAAARR